MKAYVKARSAGTFLVESTHAWFHTNRRGLSVWLFALVIAALAASPPWVARTQRVTEQIGEGISSDLPPLENYLQHSPLWHRPSRGSRWTVRVDFSRFFLEAVAAESLVAALYLTWGRKER